MSIPVSNGIIMNIIINTTYTLEKIENNKAYFNFTSVYNFDTQNLKMINGTGSGKGQGQMIYDVTNKFITNNKEKGNIKIGFKTEQNLNIDMQIEIDTNEITVIN